MKKFQKILVPGGAGYVGAVLVPELLSRGYEVVVYDLYIYGKEVFDSVRPHSGLTEIEGDIRDTERFKEALKGVDAVIHLACISNDPSVELDPELSHSVNFLSFEPCVAACRDLGVKRFIFASSGSVYGISDEPNVTEEHELVPVSHYNRYKAMCEPILLKYQTEQFVPVIIRPATICGYSPRQRLDLTVNILTNLAVNKGAITVFGGTQMRPNIHMKDIVELYCLLLECDDKKIAGQIFNAGFENLSVSDIATFVREIVKENVPGRKEIEIQTTSSDDPRSYHLSSAKLDRELGFGPKHSVRDGIMDLIAAFNAGKLPGSLEDPRYFNVKLMKQIKLQ